MTLSRNTLGITLIICTTAVLALGQDNPHARHMERAHPTPAANVSYTHLQSLVPMLGENVFPSMFLNTNMIIPETDPLPAQNESSIAVNPIDPTNLIGSAVDYRGSSSTWAYYSKDGGKTWANVTLGTARSGWTSSNDPSVCFDHTGRGYLCYGGFRREGNVQFGENGIFVSSTNDGGTTWDMRHTAVIIHTGQQTADSAFEDKYYIHADTAGASPYRGHLYIPWKRVINRDSSTQIVIVKSTDQGRTWSAPVAVSDRFPGTSEATTFGQSFPLARTGPDGSVHLVWNSGTENALRYARSLDGGATWTAPRIIHQYRPFGVKSTINGQSNSRVKGVVRAECYPTLTIDNTGGPRNGWLYITWAADNYPNVYFSRSTDNGTTWSAAKVVHSDTTNDQFWSWIALDPTSGEVAIMYSDSRDDAENIFVNTYVSWSADGGETWADKRVGDDRNDLRRNPFQGNTFAGDYSGCDFYNGYVYPSWVDMRNTYSNPADNDVFTAVVDSRAPQAPSRFTARTVTTRPTEIDLSWSTITSLSFGQTLPPSATIVLQRNGTTIATLPITDTTFTDTGLEKYSLYKYTLTASANGRNSAPRNAEAYAGGSRALGPTTLLSATGNADSTITTVSVLPSRRLDGVTPIINLDSLLTNTSELVLSTKLQPTDTGKQFTDKVRVPERGWYEVSTRVADTDGNAGGASDTVWTYAGNRDIHLESYTTEPRYLRIAGQWGRTTNFFRTAPASFAHAPVGPYQPNRRDTLMLAPLETSIPAIEGISLVLTCYVAAFVDASDTMFLEVSQGNPNGPWESLEWWNASKDARWLDTTKSDDAWRAQYLPIRSYNSGTMYVRLRFRSNATRHSDGFYIDDLSYTTAVSVTDDERIVRETYPTPASTHVVVTLTNDAPITNVRLTNMQGGTLPTGWTQSGRTLVVPVQGLSSGMYSLVIGRDEHVIILPVVVLR